MTRELLGPVHNMVTVLTQCHEDAARCPSHLIQGHVEAMALATPTGDGKSRVKPGMRSSVSGWNLGRRSPPPVPAEPFWEGAGHGSRTHPSHA